MAYLSILSMCNQLKGAKSKKVDDGTSSMETSLNDSSAAIKVCCTT